MMLAEFTACREAGTFEPQGVVDTMTQPNVVLDQRLCMTTSQ
jgi:hypothetical protein